MPLPSVSYSPRPNLTSSTRATRHRNAKARCRRFRRTIQSLLVRTGHVLLGTPEVLACYPRLSSNNASCSHHGGRYSSFAGCILLQTVHRARPSQSTTVRSQSLGRNRRTASPSNRFDVFLVNSHDTSYLLVLPLGYQSRRQFHRSSY